MKTIGIVNSFKKHSAKWVNILNDFFKGDLFCVAQSASWYKRGPYDCEEGEGHFFYRSFFLLIFWTYSYFSMFMKDNTICSEEQLYHKAIYYFTSIETLATCFDQLIANTILWKEMLRKTYLRHFARLFFDFPFLGFRFLLFLCNMKNIILILEIWKLFLISMVAK